MHQPILRKDTKTDRSPPPFVVEYGQFASAADYCAAFNAGRDAAAWLARITKEPR